MAATSAEMLAFARGGDLAGAIALGEQLVRGGADVGILMFTGSLCCRNGDLTRGVEHFRAAVALAPAEPLPRIELARALLAAGADGEVLELAPAGSSVDDAIGRELLRLRAGALLRQSSYGDAAAIYERLVAADGNDFESWHGLGLARLGTGTAKEALAALQVATRLRPQAASHWVSLARAQIALDDFAAAAGAARRAVELAPGSPNAQVVLARALANLGRINDGLACLNDARQRVTGDAELLREIGDAATLCQAADLAEEAYRAALAAKPDCVPALLGLGSLYERTNRIEELTSLLHRADQLEGATTGFALLRARVLQSAGSLEDALAVASAAPSDGPEAARRSQLIGEIADRLGRTEAAFEAFVRANSILEAATRDAHEAEEYRRTLVRLTGLLTPAWYGSWTPSPPSSDRSPLFIFGFPRSGTTLLDTMLIGHPDVLVLEETGIIHQATERLGPIEKLPGLSAPDIERLRQAYRSSAQCHAPNLGDRLIVDKDPLGLIGTPMLHRLFPDARYLFAERHPCDVVLSCFIISSRLNMKVAHFFDLVSTARLYDQVMRYWERCRAVLPLKVYVVRYERLISNTAAELRRVTEFAGLAWNERLLDHQANAEGRAFIGSPSYAQVKEPIYARASGRWRRYRKEMTPALPILQPWIEKLGYDMDET